MLDIGIDSFNVDSISNGEKERFLVRFERTSGDESLCMPVVVANGSQPGRTLVALAGVHGDEYEGVRAIQEFFDLLSPVQMSGRFVGVPVANPPAYFSGRRLSPLDLKNMARVFPGNRAGTPTDRLADFISTAVISQGDFLIDLHSAGTHFWFPPLIGYSESDSPAGQASKAAARVFGMPVMWGHPRLSPGRTLSVAQDLGIPWLYTESVGGARLSKQEFPYYQRGLVNLARHLRILPGEVKSRRGTRHFIGDGDVDQSVIVRQQGLFMPVVDLLQDVSKGQVIGEVIDLFGKVIEKVAAPSDGSVMMLRGSPVVSAGDPVCVVAQEVFTDASEALKNSTDRQ